VTTCLTLGKPFQLPWATAIFHFSPAEFRRLFPERVVAWMEQHPGRGKPVDSPEFGRLLPFPEARHLPVVVATRLSLCFPALLAAIPLYAVDWGLPDNDEAKRHGRPPRYERCWFSDGGICSNFPVHFFDRLVPRWPTFGLNLRGFRDGQDPPAGMPEDQKIYLPRTNRDGVLDWWTRFDGSDCGLTRLAGFAGAILNAMQNWRDNTQLAAPGYRDRVAHVLLASDEGGLNLVMPEGRVAALAERGRAAAAELAHRFTTRAGPDNVLSWDNHRWVRYRSVMALLEDALAGLSAGLEYVPPDGAAGNRTVIQLIARAPDDYPRSYEWDPKDDRQRSFAIRATDELVKLQGGWAAAGTFRPPPRPEPDLRVVPQMGGVTANGHSTAAGHDEAADVRAV
jgi:hypothetical protein